MNNDYFANLSRYLRRGYPLRGAHFLAKNTSATGGIFVAIRSAVHIGQRDCDHRALCLFARCRHRRVVVRDLCDRTIAGRFRPLHDLG